MWYKLLGQILLYGRTTMNVILLIKPIHVVSFQRRKLCGLANFSNAVLCPFEWHLLAPLSQHSASQE